MTRKKDGRKTKQFALKASVNNINHWNNMTDAERKARVDKMQAGRRRKQAEKEQANREAYTYDPIREWVQSTLKTGPYAPKKPRPLDIAKTNMAPDRAKAAFDKVSVARDSRVLVNGIKEVALREDDIEITADEEYVGISWQKLQSLVYQMMKEMDNE